MKYFYGEFNGEDFPSQDTLFGFDQMMQFIMEHGDQALKALQQMLNDPNKKPEHSELLEELLKQGLLDKDGKGKLRLTPRAIGRMQRKALMEVFANLRLGQRDGHEKITPGQGGERVEGTKPYQFGDPVSELDLGATLKNALHRQGLPEGKGSGFRVQGSGQKLEVRSEKREGPSSVVSGPLSVELDDALAATDNGQRTTDNEQVPSLNPEPQTLNPHSIKFTEKDFELHLHEGMTTCSTVVLLDMSGSMMRYGRFMAAKQVAMAMQALVRQRFPGDSIDFVGFYSGAHKIAEAMLPLAMPKPVTIYDYQVRMKVPIDQLERAPQHFTNLHLGLQLARRILRKRASENKQLFIITDGQPTAHVEGDFVHLLYPPDKKSTLATLKEAVLAVRDGCRISTFALIEDYWGMDWVGFVDQLTKLTRGVAFYTSSDQLASCIMESYLSGRKKKTHIA